MGGRCHAQRGHRDVILLGDKAQQECLMLIELRTLRDARAALPPTADQSAGITSTAIRTGPLASRRPPKVKIVPDSGRVRSRVCPAIVSAIALFVFAIPCVCP